jgi:nucleoside-diphosphate-sugar epimerase
MSDDLARLTGRRILITGATGFIGSRLCSRLRDSGAQLHAVSRAACAENSGNFRWWQADLAEAEAVSTIISAVRPDLIFHLASHVSGSRERDLVLPMLQSNLLSTVNLLTAAAERRCRVILAGSMEEPEGAEVGPVPCSPYAAAKWAAGGYARMFHALYGVPAVTLRIFMVYGPGQKDMRKLIPYVSLALLRGEAPRLTTGQRRVDWVFVEDVVDALLATASTEGLGGATLDVGSGMLVTVREVAERLKALANSSIAPMYGAVEERPLETMRVADVARTEETLGWRPRTPLGEGLERTLAWFRREMVKFD